MSVRSKYIDEYAIGLYKLSHHVVVHFVEAFSRDSPEASQPEKLDSSGCLCTGDTTPTGTPTGFDTAAAAGGSSSGDDLFLRPALLTLLGTLHFFTTDTTITAAAAALVIAIVIVPCACPCP